MKKWRKYVPLAGLFLILAVAAIIMIPANAKTDETSTIPQRVYFGDIAVGGMTQEEAAAAVQNYLNELQNKTVTLKAGNNSVDVSVSQMGLTWANPEIAEEAAGLGKSGNLIVRYKAMKDLENQDKVYELAYKADSQKISQMLEENAQTLNTEANAVTASGYTQNGVTLKTIIWTQNLNDSFRACSDIRIALVREFGKSGIEIPYQTVTISNYEPEKPD